MSVSRLVAEAEPLLSAADLAEVLGVTRRWLYGQVEEQGLPAYKVGRTLLFELSAVRLWLGARRVGDWGSCGEPPDGAGIPSTMQGSQDG